MKTLFAAIWTLVLVASTVSASEFATPVCIVRDEPRADSDQMLRLNEYLIWKGFELEGSVTNPTMLLRKERRVLRYLLEGAVRPGPTSSAVYLYPIEIHQFSSEDEARNFSPYETFLADDPVDLSAPGALDRHIALYSQTHRNSNLVLFLQTYPDKRMEAEDMAAAALVRNRFIQAFLDFSNQAYEEERRVHDALMKVRDAIELEDAVGQARLLEVLLYYDEVDYARRLSPGEREKLDFMLRAMISGWQSSIDRANKVLDQPLDALPWAVPKPESVPLLVEMAESAALLPYHREIEKAAVDLMYRSITPPEYGDYEAIREALQTEMDSGQLREVWRLHRWEPEFGLKDVRIGGSLAGAVVYPASLPPAAPLVRDTPVRIGTIPSMSILFSSSGRSPAPEPSPMYAVYLRKHDRRWELRRIVPLRDSGWAVDSYERP